MVRRNGLRWLTTACLVALLGLSPATPARANFIVSIYHNGGANGSLVVKEPVGGGLPAVKGGAGVLITKATTSEIDLTATVDGYKFEVQARSNRTTTPTPADAIVCFTAKVTGNGIAGNFGINVADDGFTFPGTVTGPVNLFADLWNVTLSPGNSIENKSAFNGTFTPYTTPVTGSVPYLRTGKQFIPVRGTSFTLTGVTTDIQSTGSGVMEFTADAVVGMPEPSALVMALIGLPLALIGVRRRLRRSSVGLAA